MSEYNNLPYGCYQDELYHYGVLGMKWGVHRATKRLMNPNSTERQKAKAVASLQKHQSKAAAEVLKLQKQRPALEKAVNKHLMKNDEKAANLKERSAKLQKKAYGRFTSKDRAGELLYKAGKLDARANSMSARSEKAKALLAKNDAMQDAFDQGIKDIGKTFVNAGKAKVTDLIRYDEKTKLTHVKSPYSNDEKLKESAIRVDNKYDKMISSAKDQKEIDDIEARRRLELLASRS